jgi:hypothetical protein
MPKGLKIVLLVGAAIVAGPATGQAVHNEAGMITETQERLASQHGDSIWNLIGLVGLFGLIGLWRPSDNDGYTDDPI